MKKIVPLFLVVSIFLFMPVVVEAQSELDLHVSQYDDSPAYGVSLRLPEIDFWSLGLDVLYQEQNYEDYNFVLQYKYPEQLLPETETYLKAGFGYLEKNNSIKRGLTTGFLMNKGISENLSGRTEVRIRVFPQDFSLFYRTGFYYDLNDNLDLSLSYSGFDGYHGLNLGTLIKF